MLIAALLGLHALLLVGWVWQIARGKSRLRLSHVLFSACLPFVGELCLLVCEYTMLPNRPPYRSPFVRENPQWADEAWTLPANWRERILDSEDQARAFLLQIIRHQPRERIQVYQAGLESESSEICHLCAAALQKEHDAHEDAVSRAALALSERPGNEGCAAELLKALRNYRCSGLPDNASAQILRSREQSLLLKWPALRMSAEEKE